MHHEGPQKSPSCLWYAHCCGKHVVQQQSILCVTGLLSCRPAGTAVFQVQQLLWAAQGALRAFLLAELQPRDSTAEPAKTSWVHLRALLVLSESGKQSLIWLTKSAQLT